MKLKTIAVPKSKWRVLARYDEDSASCAVEDELKALVDDKKTRRHAESIYALMRRIPREGPKALGKQFYHYVDENNEIAEFIHGPLRVFGFVLHGTLVICSHSIRKKSQKTKKSDIEKAARLRSELLKLENLQDHIINEGNNEP